MKITDITGTLKNGMWSYGEPFPEYRMKPLPEVPWVKNRVWCEIFEGLNSQCGTYLETPAHFFGYSESYMLSDVPVERLIDMPAEIIMLNLPQCGGQRHRITLSELEAALDGRDIRPGGAIIVGCGWGNRWFSEDYLTKSPYFSREAMEKLISLKPFLLGSDLPRWDSLEAPEGFWEEFYRADILMLAPTVNLESLDTGKTHLLTVLPLKAEGTCCAPCRAIIKEG